MSRGPSWSDEERAIITEWWEHEHDGELAVRIAHVTGRARTRPAVKRQRIRMELLHAPTRTGKRGRRTVSMTADRYDEIELQAEREGEAVGTLVNRVMLEYLLAAKTQRTVDENRAIAWVDEPPASALSGVAVL